MSEMFFMPRRSKFFAIVFILFPLFSFAEEALDSELIWELKEVHKRSCVPNITQQLNAAGFSFLTQQAHIYCECLGIHYFNDFTESDFAEMKQSAGNLPARIATNRRDIAELCADLHL